MIDSQTTSSWNWIDINDPERPHQLLEIERLVCSHAARNLDQSPDWLEAKAEANQGSYRLCVNRDSTGNILGYAPLFIHRSQFELAYAGRSIAKYRIQRYALTGQPLLDPTVEDDDSAIEALLSFLRSKLAGREVVFLLGLRLESPLGQMITSGQASRHFLILTHGASYERRLASVPKSLDLYLAALGKKTRQDLRRQERRLNKAADDSVTLAVFNEPASVGEFLAAAEKVSRLTYQWNLLGIGVQQQESTLTLLTKVAQQGRLRGYVMSARGNPIAFMVGYLDGNTYYSESIGYDPDWGEYSAGNVLHLHVIRDLAGLDHAVEWFDFMYGDNSNKARLSTDHHQEQNFYLVPKTARWRLIVGVVRAFDAMTNQFSQLLERYDLKDRIRRIMRSRSIRGRTKTNSE